MQSCNSQLDPTASSPDLCVSEHTPSCLHEDSLQVCFVIGPDWKLFGEAGMSHCFLSAGPTLRYLAHSGQ